ncbi:MAG: FeoB-associated Cys-rich membrane protein [Planctomicrobium sp.]|nr:FeoB-associated Cys-rich membrane protein [Planctomicrobium sp.]
MDWQTSITILIILFAAWRVWRRLWSFVTAKEENSCGGCHACPSGNDSNPAPKIVTLDY